MSNVVPTSVTSFETTLGQPVAQLEVTPWPICRVAGSSVWAEAETDTARSRFSSNGKHRRILFSPFLLVNTPTSRKTNLFLNLLDTPHDQLSHLSFREVWSNF